MHEPEFQQTESFQISFKYLRTFIAQAPQNLENGFRIYILRKASQRWKRLEYLKNKFFTVY